MSPECTVRASQEAKPRVIIGGQYALQYIMHVHAGLGRVNWNKCASCLLTWYRGLGGRMRDLPGSVDGGSWPIGMRETTWGYDKNRYLNLFGSIHCVWNKHILEFWYELFQNSMLSPVNCKTWNVNTNFMMTLILTQQYCCYKYYELPMWDMSSWVQCN